jgi:type III pantothenate kinase
MKNLCIDTGNSLTKICVFENNKLIHKVISESIDFSVIRDLIQKFPGIENAILSTVKKDNPEFTDLLNNQFKFFINFSQKTPLPVKNQYKTKETLGKDRIAAIVGANNMFPQSNVLVVDAGTAITYDFINSQNEYLGGNISPGMNMRYRALNRFTDNLPLVEPAEEFLLLGDSTNQAIISGVVNGLIFEIDGYINKLKEDYQGLITILTGGDAIFFDKKLKNTIFVDQNLVLTGLNRIIEYNVKKS